MLISFFSVRKKSSAKVVPAMKLFVDALSNSVLWRGFYIVANIILTFVNALIKEIILICYHCISSYSELIRPFTVCYPIFTRCPKYPRKCHNVTVSFAA